MLWTDEDGSRRAPKSFSDFPSATTWRSQANAAGVRRNRSAADRKRWAGVLMTVYSSRNAVAHRIITLR